MNIKTKRLLIREFRFSDDIDLYDMCSDEATAKTAGWKPIPDLNITRSIIASYIYENETFVITNKDTFEFLGTISLYKNDSRVGNHRELGFCMNKRFRGKGYMSEAVNAIKNYSFEDLNIDTLSVCHDISNIACEKVVLKNEFKYEGTLRRYRILYDDTLCDCKVYTIIKEEFRRNL